MQGYFLSLNGHLLLIYLYVVSVPPKLLPSTLRDGPMTYSLCIGSETHTLEFLSLPMVLPTSVRHHYVALNLGQVAIPCTFLNFGFHLTPTKSHWYTRIGGACV